MAGVKGRSGSGGPRPGSGPKPKAVTRRSTKAAQKLAADEAITPLEVMVLTMREMWGDGTLPLERKKEACAIAEKCAPYLHPRLASTQVTADINSTIKGASTEELRAELKSILAEIGGS